MRAATLLPLLLLTCPPLLVAAALAQTPQAGTQAGGQGPAATTPAPVPGVVPGAPASTGPGTIPDQVAPPATTAGPPDATPFSAAPSAQLPSDNSVILRRDNRGTGQASPVPNLSK